MIWERKYKYDKSSAAIDSTNRVDWSPRRGKLKIAKFFFFSYILSRICTTIEIPNFEREEKEKREREEKKKQRKTKKWTDRMEDRE